MASLRCSVCALILATGALVPVSASSASKFYVSDLQIDFILLSENLDFNFVLRRFIFNYKIDPLMDADISNFIEIGPDPVAKRRCGVGIPCFEVSLKYFVGPGVPAIVVNGWLGRSEDFVEANPPDDDLVHGLDCPDASAYWDMTCSVPLSVRFNRGSTEFAGTGVFGVVPLPAGWALSGAAVAALIAAGRPARTRPRRADRSQTDLNFGDVR